MDNKSEERVCKVITKLANAWRGNWTHFDGRTLKKQLSRIKKLIRQEEGVTEQQVEETVEGFGICLKCGAWDDSFGCNCEE
jgi:hypothetical protein